MKKFQNLSEQCEHVFEEIIKGNLTDETLAKVFSNLKGKGLNYSDAKLALLRAGDLESRMETDIITRDEIGHLFNWGERSVRDNLQKWGLPLLRIYKRNEIFEKAKAANWRCDEKYGWIKSDKRKESE